MVPCSHDADLEGGYRNVASKRRAQSAKLTHLIMLRVNASDVLNWVRTGTANVDKSRIEATCRTTKHVRDTLAGTPAGRIRCTIHSASGPERRLDRQVDAIRLSYGRALAAAHTRRPKRRFLQNIIAVSEAARASSRRRRRREGNDTPIARRKGSAQVAARIDSCIACSVSRRGVFGHSVKRAGISSRDEVVQVRATTTGRQGRHKQHRTVSHHATIAWHQSA